jgi:hypothetical protein
MILKYCVREDLVNLLKNEAISNAVYEVADDSTLVSKLRPDSELHLIWGDKLDYLPVAIIVNNSKRDFLAWASAYLINFKPVTAFFRVFDIDFCSSVVTSIKSSFNIDRRCVNVFIGLTIAETLTYLEEGHSLDNMNLSTCSRTFSYIMSKAFYLGFVDQVDFLSSSWFKLRNLLTSQTYTTNNFNAYKLPWVIFINLLGRRKLNNQTLFDNNDSSPNMLYLAAEDFMLNGKISENILNKLLRGDTNIKYHLFTYDGTREERVLSFQKILPTILESPLSEQIKSFIAAYLVDRLAPGTFEHFNILRGLTRRLPSSLMWYGFFSGLNRKSQLRDISFGLGHRLLRDILRVRPIFARPEGDISYDEFNMLISKTNNLSIRTKIKGQLEIEILPNISTNISWPLNKITEAQKQVPPYEIQKLKNEFESTISRLKDNYQKALELINISDVSDYSQRKLIKKERSKKSK